MPEKILEKLVATAHLEKWDPNFTGICYFLDWIFPNKLLMRGSQETRVVENDEIGGVF